MDNDFPPLDSPGTLDEALELLRRTPGGSLPILDPDTGQVVAVLSRPGAFPPPAPPRLGGMATPLGVYLTDGIVSGGAGFWGLFLTGIVLGALALLSQAIVNAALTLARAHGHDVWAWAESPARPVALRPWLSTLVSGLPVPLIFVLLRLIPMSGTHAAEHQVVHCIERGLPLTPDCVRAMPRVHPRCGTNLFIGLSLFLLVFVGAFCAAEPAPVSLANGIGVADAATVALILAAPPALLFWRRIGGFVQQWFATRPATDLQIAGGIRAAQEVLLRRRQTGEGVRFRPLRRVWSMGFAQVLLGYAALLGPLSLALDHCPALANWLGM